MRDLILKCWNSKSEDILLGKYMNKEQKNRLEELKIQIQEKERQQILQKNVLYQECLTALNSYTLIEDEDVIRKLVHLALQMVRREWSSFMKRKYRISQ